MYLCLILSFIGILYVNCYVNMNKFSSIHSISWKKSNLKQNDKNMKLHLFNDITSQFISVMADPAAEIEAAVGEEIYGPIFKAGIFIFASGLVSAFIAAAIVSSRDSWDDLDSEFEQGKMKQLIDNSAAEALLSGNVNNDNVNNSIVSENKVDVKENEAITSNSSNNEEDAASSRIEDGVEDLDL